ncbi:phage repressor protein CI [Salmonella enterica]|nr:phage repressor protein CI [Salmonella enterica]EKQ7596797.1 phage repressor protein CI [Salmonella enterica subsp. enterica serovar Johannesburg]EHO8795430.1 phage repressor protein CI [Salmonella enterica]EHP3623844.1 phage repressor protein CI [Salmonella enterica]EHQ7984242.1 phage repressor protein CI [Salmonella enterica]
MIQNWKCQQQDFTNRKSIQLPHGGKDPIERICAAYGFTSRQALCRHLDVSQSTMANRVTRGNFPADWVLICAMETGASLDWLVFGRGEGPKMETHIENTNEIHQAQKTLQLSFLSIQNGVVKNQKQIDVAPELIPTGTTSPRLVGLDSAIWIVDDFAGELVDGFWLTEMDGVISIREMYRLPGGRVRVENGKASFECNAADVTILGKAIGKTEFME